MTALVISPEGLPLGIANQEMWVREERSKRVHSGHRRTGHARYGGEGRFWREALHGSTTGFVANAPDVTPWYQLDRGGDCWQVLDYAAEADLLLTVRACHDRRLDADADRLWEAVERSPVLETQWIEVPARGPTWKRQRRGGHRYQWLAPATEARRAKVAIRATTVPLRIHTPEGPAVVEFNAVLVREVRPHRERVEWLLLTTHPVGTLSDVRSVVRGYSFRWRVEDFHRVWKRGLCRVEDTQLRSRDAIYKWATVLAAVATRAMRLTHLARTAPDTPASQEFSPYELRAVIALREPPEDRELTLGDVVRWIADLGGYIGPRNGPPGATVIGRGLRDVLVAARALENRAKKR